MERRTVDRMFRAMLALSAGVLLATWLTAGGTAWAQAPATLSPSGTLGWPAEQVLRLMSGDETDRLDALDRLRQDPEAARDALLAALTVDPPPAERWRVAHALTEFGRPEDIPTLLSVLDTTQDNREREALRGAIQALYQPHTDSADLSLLVQDFSFIQTSPQTPVGDNRTGKRLLSDWSFQGYHQDGVPPQIIRKLQPLRGVLVDTTASLEQAIRQRLSGKEWNRYKTVLMNGVDTVPPRTLVEGTVRTQLLNPSAQPLLLVVGIDAWFGAFRDPPPPRWVYLDPGARLSVDIPTVLVGDGQAHGIRLDLRLREVDGRDIPNYHKLSLAMQP